MIELTILNYCLNSIRVWLVYTENWELFPSIKTTSFFGNGDYKILTIPNNCYNASITIDILYDKDLIIPARSFKFDNIIVNKTETQSKFLQFVGYKNLSDPKDYFYDILEIPMNTNFSINQFINFNNESLSSAKCDLTFEINFKGFKYETIIIKRKKNVSFKLPFNCNNVQLRIFTLDILNKLKLVQVFYFANTSIQKCYTLTSNLLNTSFSIKETSCS